MTRRAMMAGGMAGGAASGLMVGFICQTAVFLGRCFPGPHLWDGSARFRAAMVPYWQTRVQVRKRDFPHPDGCFVFEDPNGCITSNVHEGEARCRKRSRWFPTTATS